MIFCSQSMLYKSYNAYLVIIVYRVCKLRSPPVYLIRFTGSPCFGVCFFPPFSVFVYSYYLFWDFLCQQNCPIFPDAAVRPSTNENIFSRKFHDPHIVRYDQDGRISGNKTETSRWRAGDSHRGAGLWNPPARTSGQ